ncbi:MAG: DUF2812 domain-containing protein [Solobacterium sp.]|nr:DUF2812 domain-containing protein [Solobacterium sp.]
MTERKTLYKWFFVWDFDKEEAWLNEMALNGWVLVDVGLCRYTFERCEPGEYIIRLEMHGSDPDYVSFMEETGANYIGRCVQWIYFSRRSEYGEFNIFSDIDSKISHLQGIARMLMIIGAMNLLIGMVNVNEFSRINLLCATLLMYGLGRIHGKIEYLENERRLHE